MAFSTARVTGRAIPAALAAAAALGFAITCARVPVVWIDETIYASIARGLQLHGIGAPTMLDGAPTVDHVRFYGPVYFALAAAAFRVFGFALETFRAIGIAGALVSAAAGAALVRAFGRGRERQLWTAALILLTPELGSAATTGRMDSVALAWSMLALTAYCGGLIAGRRPWAWGTAAGACLALAALTVPRTFPFVGIFAITCVAVAARRRAPAGGRAVSIWTVAVLAAVLAAWATWAHGGPLAWIRFDADILRRETWELGTPGASRDWSAVPWHLITPAAAVAGLLAAGAWHDEAQTPARRTAGRAALAIASLTFAISLAIVNFTFALAVYFAVVPLAVVLALLPPLDGRQRAAVLAGLALLLGADVAVRAAKYARVAATWDARDPRPIDRFVASAVPPGAVVLGPGYFYFYAVERAGAHYLSASRTSGADWTRLVSGRVLEPLPAGPRYLLWPDGATLDADPPELRCAGLSRAGHFTPAPARAIAPALDDLPGILPPSYPAATLYRLPPGCARLH